MKKILFKDWELNVDFLNTQKLYTDMDSGAAELCNCTDCENFIDNRNNLYPTEVRALLNELGVDYSKEGDIWKICKENNLHRYSGCFFFVGNFKGENSIQPLSNSSSETILKTVTDNFSIGFCNCSYASINSKSTHNTIQIEFEARIPWTIDKTENT